MWGGYRRGSKETYDVMNVPPSQPFSFIIDHITLLSTSSLHNKLPFDSIPFIFFSNDSIAVHVIHLPLWWLQFRQSNSPCKIYTVKFKFCLTQKNIRDSRLANNRKVNRSVILQPDISNITGDDEVSGIRSGLILHCYWHTACGHVCVLMCAANEVLSFIRVPFTCYVLSLHQIVW